MGLIDKIRDFGSKIVKRIVSPKHSIMKTLRPEIMNMRVGGKGSYPTKEHIEAAAKNRPKNTILSSQTLGLNT